MAKRKLNVALIGAQFMGKAHSNAYRQVCRFFDTEIEPVMKVICALEPDLPATAAKFGWEEHSDNWQETIARSDIDLVDVCTPNFLHAPVAIAAAKAGKHVLCEKPLAGSLADAKAMLAAGEEAGITHAISHNYRKVPAVALAKKLIAEGKLGTIYHWRGTYLQDWIIDPEFPLVWRLDKKVAGSGAHGDLNAHLIDLSRFLIGEITEVSGMMETFIKQRPKLAAATGGLSAIAAKEMGEVTVDDASIFMARFENGTIGTFEATRFAQGHRNSNCFEINGSKGSVKFDLERMGELQVYMQDDAEEIQGFRTIVASAGCHPYMGGYWPAGHIIGWEHTFINQVKDLLEAIAAGKPASPNWADGVKNQAVLEAVEVSANSRKWEPVTV